MSKKVGQLKNNFNKNFPIYIIFTFVVLIILTVIFSLSNGEGKQVKRPKVKEEIIDEVMGLDSFGIIKEINVQNKTIIIYEQESGQDITLFYNGASDFRDKYGQIKTAQQFSVGFVVNFNYDRNLLKLNQINESKDIWEHSGVNLWNMDKSKGLLTIGSSNYKIADDVIVYRENELITLESLDNKDELYVRGNDRDVISIGVTKGHGTIKFVEYEDFIGGIAYIGKREVIPIVENMTITAREGTFDVMFEKGDWKGTKTVTLLAEDKITVSMEEYKKPPVQIGKVEFDIMPLGSDLLIDNEKIDYEDVITLEYGEHKIEVSLGGYTSYQGTLEVLEEFSRVTIRLVETNADDSEGETEVEVESGTEDNISNNGETSIVSESSMDGRENEEPKKSTTTPSPIGKDGANEDGAGDLEGDYIHVLTPEEVSVYFDGDFMGNTPVSFPKEIGTHYVTLIKDGYETKTYTVQVEDNGKNTILNFPNMMKNE